MSNGPDKNSLDLLSERIAVAKKAAEKPSKGQHHEAEVQSAWRMVIELVTGMLVGFGIGYGLDYFFDTLPIFFVSFTLLGFAAAFFATAILSLNWSRLFLSGPLDIEFASLRR